MASIGEHLFGVPLPIGHEFMAVHEPCATRARHRRYSGLRTGLARKTKAPAQRGTDTGERGGILKLVGPRTQKTWLIPPVGASTADNTNFIARPDYTGINDPSGSIEARFRANAV